MNNEISFSSAKTPINATDNRIVALWYADVDRIVLDGSMPPFTGAAVLYAVFDIAGYLQYYVSLYDIKGSIFHTWKCEPGNVSLTLSTAFETNVTHYFKQMGISFSTVTKTMTTYDTILKKLPLTRVLDDKTPCVGEFDVNAFAANNGTKLSAESKNAIKAFITMF